MQIFQNKGLHQSAKPYLLLQKKAIMFWTNISPGAEKKMHSLVLKCSGIFLSYAASDENYEKCILHVTIALLPQTLTWQLCLKRCYTQIHIFYINKLYPEKTGSSIFKWKNMKKFVLVNSQINTNVMVINSLSKQESNINVGRHWD